MSGGGWKFGLAIDLYGVTSRGTLPVAITLNLKTNAF